MVDPAQSPERRSARLLTLSCGLNAVLLRTAEIEAIYREACLLAVEGGGFEMAWVGLNIAASPFLELVAHSGPDCAYPQRIPSFSFPGGDVVLNGPSQEPEHALWKGPLKKHTYQSAAAFPLLAGAEVVGAFAVYSDRQREFDGQFVFLLRELAQNMSFAIEFRRSDRERRRALAALRESEDAMAAAQQLARFGSWELDLTKIRTPGDHPVRWSDEMYRIMGYEPGGGEVTDAFYMSHIHPDDYQKAIVAITGSQVDQSQITGVHRIIRPDGEIRFLHLIAHIYRDPATGRRERLLGTAHDITERTLQQEAHRLAREASLELARQQAAVARLGQRALEGIPLNRLCQVAVDCVAEILDMDYAGLLELLPDGKHLRMIAAFGWDPSQDGLLNVDIEGTQSGYTLAGHEAVVLEDLEVETRFGGHPKLREKGITSGISASLPADRGHWSVITAHCVRKRKFSRDDVNFFQSVATVVAQATLRHRMEEALSASEERYQLGVRGSGAGLWDMNLLADEVFFAPRFEEMLGYRAGDFQRLGWSYQKAIHPDDVERVRQVFHLHIADRKVPFDVELRLRTRDYKNYLDADLTSQLETHFGGEYRWFNARAEAVRNADGVAYRMVGSIIDITESKRARVFLQESEEKLRQALETAQASEERLMIFANVTNDAIWDWELDSNRFWCNEGFSKLFGYEQQEIGHTIEAWSSRLVPDERERVMQGLRSRIEQGSPNWTDEYHFTRKDGSVAFVLDRGYVIRTADGRPVRIIVGMTDLSERRARLAAEKASELKSQFLANMSHEIRTPLNAILGMSYLALATDLNPRQRRYLNDIQSGGQTLLALVNDILDFSKVEAGRLELEQIEFQLDAVLGNVLAVLGRTAEEGGLELQVETGRKVPYALVGDPVRLGQVLLNLVGNAIKFTRSGYVRLSIEVRSVAETEIVLVGEVTDTGIGMNAEQMGGLFKAFTQADSSITRKYGGTGLGLALCKSLVQLMKGHIEVRSEPGSGSTFSFTASFGRVSAPSVPVPLWPDGPRTLVVEEDSRSLVLLAAALEDLGLPVTGVSSAVDAERELREVSEPYSLALVDFAVIGRERLLSNLRERKICFVLLVRHRDEGRTGDNEVLLRPFTRSGLFRAASEAVRVLAVAKPRSDVAKPTPVAPVPKGVRLLVVEDNVTNQRIARELLEASGYTVDCLSDGREAVEKVLSYSAVLPWAAILMDVQMPEMDGCSATVAIRQRPQFRDIPILAMTAHALADERERCFRAGMNDFISKPVDPEFLLATLRRWVSPQQVPRAEFPFIPGVDTGGAMARVAGNASLYRSLLLTLVREYPATLGALWAALNQGESVRLRQLAHALKGQAGNLGLRGVSDQAGKLESWARQDQLENCVTELGALANSFGVVCGDIASTLEGWSIPAEAANEKWLDLSESVLHFQRLLKDSDGTAPDALQELARRADGQVPTGSLDQLSRLVEQFNFKAALHELERLMAAHVLGTQKGDPR